MDRSKITKGVVATILAVTTLFAGTFINDVVVSGQNIVISQSGTAIDYVDVSCSGNVTGITVLGSYVRVHDCVVVGSRSHGIKVGLYPSAPDVHHVVIENNVVRNSVTENGIYPACGSMGGGGWGSGIKAEKGSHDVIIRNNEVYETCGEGIASTMSPDTLIVGNLSYNNYAGNIYTDISPRTIIRNNTAKCSTFFIGGRQTFGISSGAEFYAGWDGNRDGLVIADNHVEGCYDGISIFRGEPGADNALRNALIDHNTVIRGSRWSIVDGSGIVNTNVVISNNRVFRPIYVASLAGVILSNNVIYNGEPATSLPPTSTNTSTIQAPPSSTFTVSAVPSFTPTKTATVSITPTKTATIVPPTFTPTSTVIPATLNCAYVSWSRGLNIRPSPSLFNVSIGYYLFDKYVPIEGTVENSEGTWAKVNYGQYFALKIGIKEYAKLIACP